jgi:hypothetical protein
MNTRVSLKLALIMGLAICTMLAAGLLGLSKDAIAASWDAGDWKISMGGNINAFYVYTLCDDGDLGAGGGTLAGLACAGAVDKDGHHTDTSSVQNGLLPASLNFSAVTNQSGWDLSANVNVYYGIDSAGTNGDSGGADALKFSTVDARQIYLTFGKKELGSFKLGRDFGLFALDAILNDMSLIGVGAGFVASEPGHTTLGGLGFGYVYTDRLAQIDYSTPNWGGFQGTIGVFQGFDGAGQDPDGDGPLTTTVNSADMPGFHAKVSYSWDGVVKGMVSATYLTQGVIVATTDTSADTTIGSADDTIQGWDVFAKISIADLSLVGYYFDAEGMSSLAIGGLIFPGFSNVDGAGRCSAEGVSGYMAQATYTIQKVRLGINYAHSEQDKVTKVENKKVTLGVYYNLTSALTLLAEYSNQESELKAVGTDKSQNYTVGGILFF